MHHYICEVIKVLLQGTNDNGGGFCDKIAANVRSERLPSAYVDVLSCHEYNLRTGHIHGAKAMSSRKSEFLPLVIRDVH